jgi:hypothetical protein
MVTPSGKAAGGTGSGSSGTTHTHSYTSAITKQPTCTVDGEKTFTCTCGDKYTQSVAANGHSYKDGKCTVCGVSDGSTPVCNHSRTELRDAVAPSCQQDGYSGDLYCLDCNKVIQTGSQIPALMAHDFGEWHTDAEGRVYKICSECQEVQYISVEVLLAETESDAELVLLLISLGFADKMLVDELS